jgi:large subunit ribosomal protein L18
MPASKEKNKIKARRARRTRSNMHGTSARPRLSVFRSAKSTYVQLIDDDNGKTLKMATTKIADKKTKTEQAFILGQEIAKLAKDAGINEVIFDKGAYKYHGRVKAVAEGARKSGLKI